MPSNDLPPSKAAASSNGADFSRRSVLAGLAASGAAGLAPLTASAADLAPPAGVKDWLLAEGQPPIVIPLDYLGLHSDHGVSHKAPPPTYPYDAIRSHDVDDGHEQTSTQWIDIEVRPGVYDWRMTDAWFDTHKDKTRIWVLFGTPAFYQKYPGEPFPYPQHPGGNSPPRDPKDAAKFVAALLQRHPGKVDFLEIWNEPNFGQGTDPLKTRWLPNKDDPAWFSGTASDLAEMARAVKAALPKDVKLMAGAWAWLAQKTQLNPQNSVLRFADAPDGAGGTGRDHVDAISVHLYTHYNDPNSRIEEIRTYESLFEQAGYSKSLPRYATEVGAWYPNVYTKTTPPLEQKVREIKRFCMIPAAMGYAGIYLYKHSDLVSLGDPAKVPEISAAIGEMRNGLRGKTLLRAAELEDGTIWMAFSDGSQLRA